MIAYSFFSFETGFPQVIFYDIGKQRDIVKVTNANIFIAIPKLNLGGNDVAKVLLHIDVLLI